MHMDSDQSESPTKFDDDAYLKIWQVDQEHSKSRWTLTTFFMSVSFAILGFSFQDKLAPSTSLAIRISGLLIYWFAYVMFQLFLTTTGFYVLIYLKWKNPGALLLTFRVEPMWHSERVPISWLHQVACYCTSDYFTLSEWSYSGC